eukprot:SAG22_NODE_17932_length_296_cov_0.781726_2_plen_45_part_01
MARPGLTAWAKVLGGSAACIDGILMPIMHPDAILSNADRFTQCTF